MQGNIETRVGIFVVAAIGVFIFMGYQIGSVRFDRGNYTHYRMRFSDISGLSRKADVKIAGVKVGWVDSIALLPDNQLQVEADVTVAKQYILYRNARPTVRQDGLLGTKYIELNPGDSQFTPLASNDIVGQDTVEQVSIDRILVQVQKIASNIEDVTDSLRDVVGSSDGKILVQQTTENIHQATQKIASLAAMLEKSFVRNEDNIDAFLKLGTDMRGLIDSIQDRIIPTVQSSVERVSDAIDRDFNRIATKLELTGEAFQDASLQARDSLKSISSVAQKIDEGKGLVGKLINDDDTYKDLRVAIQGFKNYLNQIDRLQVVFDSHFEGMQRPGERFMFEDAKGYLDIRVYPNEDHFYLLQMATSERGFKYQWQTSYQYRDQCDYQPVNVKDQYFQHGFPSNQFVEEKTVFQRNTLKLGIQFGKVFNDLSLRFGLFEGLAGVGLDYDLPFGSESFRWITSFELFDFIGWNREMDRRPHAKWVNRMFFMDNMYVTFGADDFASKRNASAFFGCGVRFGDEDIKYILPTFSGVGGASSAVRS